VLYRQVWRLDQKVFDLAQPARGSSSADNSDTAAGLPRFLNSDSSSSSQRLSGDQLRRALGEHLDAAAPDQDSDGSGGGSAAAFMTPELYEKDVESVQSVLLRTTALITQCEQDIEALKRLWQQPPQDTKNDAPPEDSKSSATSSSSSVPSKDTSTTSVPRNDTSYVIVLISHGDTLQILQTGFVGLNAFVHHFAIPYLHPCEIRRAQLLAI